MKKIVLLQSLGIGVLIWCIVFVVVFLVTMKNPSSVSGGNAESPAGMEICSGGWFGGAHYCTTGEKAKEVIREAVFFLVILLILPAGLVVQGSSMNYIVAILTTLFLTPYIAIPIYALISYRFFLKKK